MRTIYKTSINLNESQHGDFWNIKKLAKKVFTQYPDAESFEYSLGSGLYADVKIQKSNGKSFKVTVYDN